MSIEEYKQYLSIIYGNNVEIIYDKYLYAYTDIDGCAHSKNGILLDLEGRRVFNKQLFGLFPIERGSRNIAYAAFFNDYIDRLYKYNSDDKDNFHSFIYESKSLAFDSNLRTQKLFVEGRRYSKGHPEIILGFKRTRFIGEFIDNKLVKFLAL